MKATEAAAISEKSRQEACQRDNHNELMYILDCIKSESECGLRHFVTYKLMTETNIELKKLGYKVCGRIDKNLIPVSVIIW